jgi:hypothetical protein
MNLDQPITKVMKFIRYTTTTHVPAPPLMRSYRDPARAREYMILRYRALIPKMAASCGREVSRKKSVWKMCEAVMADIGLADLTPHLFAFVDPRWWF